MQKADQRGFSVVEALLTLVVISILGFTGWFVYHARQTANKDLSSNNSADPTYKKAIATKTDAYAGWKTCDDKANGVSFKYPSSWTVLSPSDASGDPCAQLTTTGKGQEFLVQSPVSNGLAFRLWYFPAVQKSTSSDTSKLGDKLTVQSMTPITLGSKKVSLLFYRDNESTTDATLVSDLGLSDQQYSVGQGFYGNSAIASSKDSNQVFKIFASLAPTGSQSVQSYTVTQYKGQPSYGDLENIFKSVTY